MVFAKSDVLTAAPPSVVAWSRRPVRLARLATSRVRRVLPGTSTNAGIVGERWDQARTELCLQRCITTSALGAETGPSFKLCRRSLMMLGIDGMCLWARPGSASPEADAQLSPGPAVAPSSEVNDLALQAINAYRARDLQQALDLFNRIIAEEPGNSVWYERRGQVLVDLDRFEDAISDFNRAEALQGENYVSLGLLSNRALAYEGIYNFEAAEQDYSKCLDLSRELGLTGPYILNARGNARGSLGLWKEALQDYRDAAEVFQKNRNLQGTIFASANAALALIALGQTEQAVKEMEAVSRRAPGSVDMRAALAALYWNRGDEERAEETWRVACDKINSGQLVEGGSVYDGCEKYRDRDWLQRIRRWPPILVDMMMDFVSLKAPTARS